MRSLALVLAWLTYTAEAGEVRPTPTEASGPLKSREKPRLDFKPTAAFNPSLSGARLAKGNPALATGLHHFFQGLPNISPETALLEAAAKVVEDRKRNVGIRERSPDPLLMVRRKRGGKGKKGKEKDDEETAPTEAQLRGRKFAAMRRSTDSDEVKRLLDELRPLQVKEYNIGISAYGNTGDMEGALALLKEMRTEGKKPDLISFNSAMKACRENQECTLGMFDQMRDEGVKPDVITFNTALLACKMAGSWERAMSLFDEMRQEDAEVKPDEVSFKTVILACATNNAIAHAQTLLADMGSAGFTPMKIDLKIAGDDDRSKKFSVLRRTTDSAEISKLLEELRPLEVKEYNIGIGAYARAQDMDGAIALLKEMRAEGKKPDVISFNSAMSACREDKSCTLNYLDQMREDGVRPDVISYNTAISACKIAGNWEEAAGLLEEMRKDGVIPDEVSFNSVLAACEKSGAWQCAVDLLEEMRMAVVGPDLISFNIALATCKMAGQWEQASALLKQMRKAKLIPDVISYNTAIAACHPDGKWEHALFLLHSMKDKHIAPDAITYSAATSACEKGGQWQCAMSLLNEMQKVL